MKLRTSILAISIFLAAAVAVLALYDTGFGKYVTASTAAQRITGFTANKVSVYNTGSPAVFALVECTTNQLIAAVTANTAVRIPGGSSYTFDANGQMSMEAVCVMTTNSTAEVMIGAF